MTTTWAGYTTAVAQRRASMHEARKCVAAFKNSGDAFLLGMARTHVRTARAFNRHAWRGPTR